MILRLGEMVFDKVCRFIKETDILQYGVKYIEVNLSVVQCAYENLAQSYIGTMKKYDINPKHINICLLSIPLTGRYTLEPNSA